MDPTPAEPVQQPPITYTSLTGSPDVIITSSEGVEFHAHTVHLMTASVALAGMFASVPRDTPTSAAPIQIPMPETATVLKPGLMLCYQSENLDLDAMAVEQLIDLFMFADKYEIPLGKRLVELHFLSDKKFYEAHALELYTLAGQFGLKKLGDACRPAAYDSRFKEEMQWRDRMGARAVVELYEYQLDECRKQAKNSFGAPVRALLARHELHSELSKNVFVRSSNTRPDKYREKIFCNICQAYWTTKS